MFQLLSALQDWDKTKTADGLSAVDLCVDYCFAAFSSLSHSLMMERSSK